MNNNKPINSAIRIVKPALVSKASFALNSLLLAGTSVAAPITFNTALPVSQEQFIARALLVVDKKSTPTIDLEQLSLVSVLGYGVNSKLAVFGILPGRSTSREVDNISQRSSSLGDSELLGRYEVFRIDTQGTTKRIAAFAGVRIATGKPDVSGDGTNDAFAGLIYTSANSKQNIGLQVRYDLNGSDTRSNTQNGQQIFDQGDRLSADISWQKRIFPREISGHTKGFWFAGVEGNISCFQRDKINGTSNDNSGGFVASIAPGVQYSTRRWIGDLALRIPVIKDLNGDSLEPDYTLFTSLRVNF